MKLRILTLIFFGFISLSAMATDDKPGMGSITGTVISSTSNEPVSYANIALTNPADSSMVVGVITDDLGQFNLENVPFGKYFLQVSFVGFKVMKISDLEVNRQNRKVDLQQIKLEEDVTALQEIVFTEERLKGEELIDRTVFTVNDDLRKASSNGLDMLKHIPSVTVDFQQNVTLEGQSDIQFYVDGIKRNKEFVGQLDPARIDKVELITSPGAKYDSDISGIINIVLKQEKRIGVSGRLVAPLSHPDKTLLDPAGNIDFGYNKLRIYAGERFHYERFNGTETTSTQYFGENPYTNERLGQGKNRWQNSYLNYGFDWFINDKTSFNFMGEWSNWSGKMSNFHITNAMYQQSALTQYYETDKYGYQNNNNYFYSLYFKRKFDDEGSEFTAEVLMNNGDGNSENDYTDTYYDVENTDLVTDIIERNDQSLNDKKSYETRLDYTKVQKNLRHESGVRVNMGDYSNSALYNRNMEQPGAEREDVFNYNENRYVAYYNLSGKKDDWSWQAGLRGEHTTLDINDTASTNYSNLLPQFSLSRKMDKGQSVKLTYRRKLYRPSARDMSPFEVWPDSIHVHRGNPDLKPAIENRIEFAYSNNFKKNFLQPKLYYKYVDNGISDVSYIENGITNISKANIAAEHEYGLSLSGAVQIFEKWRINGEMAVFNKLIETNDEVYGVQRDQLTSWRANITNLIMLPKDYTIFIVNQYGSPTLSYQRESSRDMLMIVGLNKKFNDQFSIEMWYLPPFIDDFTYRKIDTKTRDYNEQWKGQVDAQHIFSIQLTYSFNYGRKINKLNRNVEYEKNSGGGGL